MTATCYGRPLKAGVLCSGSASSFRFLCEHDIEYGVSYEVVGVLSDTRGASGIAYAKGRGIPTAEFDFVAWCKQRRVGRADVSARVPYFEKVQHILEGWQCDLIILSGFMRILTDPVLRAYKNRILNVHPAFLDIKNPDGSRRLAGNNVVLRAIKAGLPTGSTIHIVTGEVDGGPIVVQSKPLPYSVSEVPTDPADLQAFADLHQEAMKTACDGPAYRHALDKLIMGGWPERPFPDPS